MCIHQGNPSDPCPLCECGLCDETTGLYTRTNKKHGYVEGHHKRFFGNHQQRREVIYRDKPAEPEDANGQLIASLLRKALASGATGDDLVKAFIESNELAAAIVMAQVQKALSGNVQSANWLFGRGIGTPVKKSSNSSEKLDLSSVFGNPLDSDDELYADDD